MPYQKNLKFVKSCCTRANRQFPNDNSQKTLSSLHIVKLNHFSYVYYADVDNSRAIVWQSVNISTSPVTKSANDTDAVVW